MAITRRQFLKCSGLATAGGIFGSVALRHPFAAARLRGDDRRPLRRRHLPRRRERRPQHRHTGRQRARHAAHRVRGGARHQRRRPAASGSRRGAAEHADRFGSQHAMPARHPPVDDRAQVALRSRQGRGHPELRLPRLQPVARRVAVHLAEPAIRRGPISTAAAGSGGTSQAPSTGYTGGDIPAISIAEPRDRRARQQPHQRARDPERARVQLPLR